ncbi:MAG: cobalamin biosynthesis protein [Oscillospiraceae bacterium]|nr:cobalamin biosynthesis protein [Oscillospiraceae bacterium]
MTTRILAFTKQGAVLAARLAGSLPEARLCCLPKFSAMGGETVESLDVFTRSGWKQGEALLFVGAVGIAVRAIAPYIGSKMTDPAVVVVDEAGRFAISLLSGHMGGANDLARAVAAAVGAEPVITTATDVRGKFAVDVFAKKNGLSITSIKLAKEVSAAILAGERVGLFSALPLDGIVPPELALGAAQRLNLEIGFQAELPGSLLLIPKIAYLGLGCKKGASASQIAAAAQSALAACGVPGEAVAGAASIDLKRDEPGLLRWADGLPLRFYSAAALRETPGEFTASAFVEQTAGVDNVCERAAVLAAGMGQLLQKKIAQNGATAAVAVAEKRIML